MADKEKFDLRGLILSQKKKKRPVEKEVRKESEPVPPSESVKFTEGTADGTYPLATDEELKRVFSLPFMQHVEALLIPGQIPTEKVFELAAKNWLKRKTTFR